MAIHYRIIVSQIIMYYDSTYHMIIQYYSMHMTAVDKTTLFDKLHISRDIHDSMDIGIICQNKKPPHTFPFFCTYMKVWRFSYRKGKEIVYVATRIFIRYKLANGISNGIAVIAPQYTTLQKCEVLTLS